MCVFLSFLSYPACKSHIFCVVLYCHLCAVQRYHIFPNDLLNGMIFGKKNIIDHNMCVLYSLKIPSSTFLILRRIQRDTITNTHRSSHKVNVSLLIF